MMKKVLCSCVVIIFDFVYMVECMCEFGVKEVMVFFFGLEVMFC